MNNVYSKTGKLVKRIYFGATLIWESLYALFKSRVEADGGIFDNSYTDISNDGQSLLLTPNAYKEGKLYAALPKDGTGDFTVERNSTATRVNKDGLIEIVPINTPRIDWSTGEPMLLVEGQSTNKLLFSENFSLYYAYTANVVTVEPNAAISPDGTLTADRINYDGTSVGSIYRTGFGSELKTVSFYIKGDGVNIGKTVTLEGFNIIITLTDKWQRIEGTGTIPYFSLIRTSTNTATSVLIWGAQLEEGSKATSYIPTNGSTVTRLADVITTTPPSGTTEIKETFADGTVNSKTTIPANYQLPIGQIEKVEML